MSGHYPDHLTQATFDEAQDQEERMRPVDTCPYCGGPDYVPHEPMDCAGRQITFLRSQLATAEANKQSALDRATTSLTEMMAEAARVQGENDALRGQVAGLVNAVEWPDSLRYCPTCKGRGDVYDTEDDDGSRYTCNACEGTGWSPAQRQLLANTASAARAHDAATAAKAREEERAENCKALCSWCAEGIEVRQYDDIGWG